MRYGSVCSGIEAFSVAVSHAPQWTPAWFAEIDPFCCDLLKQRYPGVSNYGDIVAKPIDEFAPVDIVVGGTPCQSFSVQGNRQGLDDERGQLALRFCEIVAQCNPRWVLWENVPGALSHERGEAFACLLHRLGKLGYFCAWRILDARHFGVAQRRRRVFLVGCRRSWRHAGAVLFEPRADGKDVGAAGKVQAGKRVDPRAKGHVIGWSGDTTPKFGINVVPTLRASQGGEGVGVIIDGRMSRLTINEWERLQGFPDDYTKLEGWSERHRRHALGNSFAVPVVRWIAERIEAADACVD